MQTIYKTLKIVFIMLWIMNSIVLNPIYSKDNWGYDQNTIKKMIDRFSKDDEIGKNFATQYKLGIELMNYKGKKDYKLTVGGDGVYGEDLFISYRIFFKEEQKVCQKKEFKKACIKKYWFNKKNIHSKSFQSKVAEMDINITKDLFYPLLNKNIKGSPDLNGIRNLIKNKIGSPKDKPMKGKLSKKQTLYGFIKKSTGQENVTIDKIKELIEKEIFACYSHAVLYENPPEKNYFLITCDYRKWFAK